MARSHFPFSWQFILYNTWYNIDFKVLIRKIQSCVLLLPVVIEEGCNCVLCHNVITYLTLHEAEPGFSYVLLMSRGVCFTSFQRLETKSTLSQKSEENLLTNSTKMKCLVSSTDLVLPVWLLRYFDHPVAKSAEGAEGRHLLLKENLHWNILAAKRSLQQLKHL